MSLSWNEIRIRAARFAEEWKDAHYERGDAQTFYNEFFEVFGVTRRRVATFEEPVKKLGDKRGRIDLFWKGVLIIEAKSAGGNLVKAKQQALDYFPGLLEHELPRFVLVCDFQNFELFDLEGGSEPVHCTLATFPDYVQAFGFILGRQRVTFRDQDPANITASELMGAVHDALEDSGYVGHDLERFLVRLLFCLFADGASIFEPRGILFELLTQRTNEDGSDTGQWISQLFEVLNTPEKERQKNLDEDLKRFPYVNGDLFQERLRIPQFDRIMRDDLIKAAGFRWETVSPAIFGSLFQSVMNKQERRRQGAHYTTEMNILKVIQPLFLDKLRDEFVALKARRDTGRLKAIEAFHDRLGNLKLFDPACGCGNFLIIAYRELRMLEIELLQVLNPKGQRVLHIESLSKIDVDQFYGIEISEFPARIAEVALWMMDHIMNNRLSLSFGENYARIPLKATPHIHCQDALEIDWATVIPPQDCDYILGNPPYGGAKVQSEKQRAQVRKIANLGGGGGTLDYVAAWFVKAGEYLKAGKASLGFVATNSITQGEQVAQLWPLLFGKYKLEIAFAHRTFAWGSDARGKAHVHVVIIGLTRQDLDVPVKRLFSYDDIEGDPTETQHKSISAYLFDAGNLADRHLVVRETTAALASVPKVIFGNMPNDDGNLILNEDERSALLASDPSIVDLVRPLIGAHDLINGKKRFCLWLVDVPPERVRKNHFVVQRIERVRAYREASKRPTTRQLAKTPSLFGEIRHTGQPYVIIPRHSSERREYVPIGFCNGHEIAHDSCLFAPDASLFEFGILTSAAHMSWLREIGGRIKNDYRYSVGLVLNTFPWPSWTPVQRSKIEGLAQTVLDLRAEFPHSSLADLYDPDFMPLPLRKAHHELDVAVDGLYRSKKFTSERDRVEHLFGLYEKLVAPLTAAVAASRVRRKSPSPLSRKHSATLPSRGVEPAYSVGKPYYITTAIAYPNGAPHIGHAYEAIATDAIARFMRLDGRDVFFLTGTDEHGIKMLQTANREKLTPRELVERNVPRFQAMVKRFNCSNDDFIRTTEARHHASSIAIWERMQANGDIYLDKYSGWYSVRDEAYYDEKETRLDDKGQRLGPQGTPVEWVEEESYFFKLSAYAEKLQKLYSDVPDFVLPKERMNEVASFVRGGLQDLSLSRTTFDWGIKVPGNPKHIMYVWVDALTNYITAVGFPDTDSEKFKKYWPADLHVIGKDIVRFHAVYWPAFLMSAGIAVPRRIFSHGFLFNRGEKMSKSVGNVIDPFALADAYGVDPLRYFLLREVPFGQDGNYSHEGIVNRINADLANDLGNLAQRSLSMVGKQFGGVLPQPGAFSANDLAMLAAADTLIGKAREAMATQQLHQVLNAVWAVVADANRYFAGEAPWALAKTDPAKQGTVLYVTAEVLRQIAILAQPFVPDSAGKLLDLLAVPAAERTFSYLGGKHRLAAGANLPAPAAVFPRYIEPEKEIGQ